MIELSSMARLVTMRPETSTAVTAQHLTTRSHFSSKQVVQVPNSVQTAYNVHPTTYIVQRTHSVVEAMG